MDEPEAIPGSHSPDRAAFRNVDLQSVLDSVVVPVCRQLLRDGELRRLVVSTEGTASTLRILVEVNALGETYEGIVWSEEWRAATANPHQYMFERFAGHLQDWIAESSDAWGDLRVWHYVQSDS